MGTGRRTLGERRPLPAAARGRRVFPRSIGAAVPPSGVAEENVPTLARIRRVLSKIPRGKVITYGQAAAAAGFPGGARLTVRALAGESGVPWHRVVGAGGRIALTGEEGMEQRLRLEIEEVAFRGGKVRMDLHAWTPRRREAPPK